MAAVFGFAFNIVNRAIQRVAGGGGGGGFQHALKFNDARNSGYVRLFY